MTPTQIAKKLNVHTRTVQRKIDRFNSEQGTDHSNGANVEITDAQLLNYLTGEPAKIEPQSIEPAKAIKPEKTKAIPLQKRLSSDVLIVCVLVIILWADMLAFSSIGMHEFADKVPYPGIVFAIIGLATGIGSVVTYNRIKDTRTAEVWKWCFGALQFAVFSLSINEIWFYAELTMTFMFVVVFVGVQRSIKS